MLTKMVPFIPKLYLNQGNTMLLPLPFPLVMLLQCLGRGSPLVLGCRVHLVGLTSVQCLHPQPSWESSVVVMLVHIPVVGLSEVLVCHSAWTSVAVLTGHRILCSCSAGILCGWKSLVVSGIMESRAARFQQQIWQMVLSTLDSSEGSNLQPHTCKTSHFATEPCPASCQ